MEEDCTDILNFYLASEATNILSFDSPWTEDSVSRPENNNKMADDDRDIQDLFDGETSPDVDQDDDNTSSISWGEESTSRDDGKEITDVKITNLRVQELNELLRDVPWDDAARIKKRRRNLKNRGYALTCRLRKQREQEDMVNENTSLKKQLQDGKCKLVKIWKEKEAYKRKCLQLQQSFTIYKQRMEAAEVPPCR